MSIFSRIRDYLTPKTVFVYQSELSRPTECERIDYEDPHKQELAVLKILALHESMQSRDIDKIYPSGWRRLNDLLHKWLVDNISKNNRFMYKINEKGLKLIK